MGLALAAVACSGDDSPTGPPASPAGEDGAVTIDALGGAAAESCPLPVLAATRAAGLESSGDVTGVVDPAPPDSTTPSGNTLELPVLQRLDGVSVACTATIEGAAVDVVLIAGRLDVAGSSAAALLPALAEDAALGRDQLQPLAEQLADLDVGAAADVPGSLPVALIRTSIEGAADAGLLVSSEGLSRAQVEDIATELDHLLH
jgi:hypothetical protein